MGVEGRSFLPGLVCGALLLCRQGFSQLIRRCRGDMKGAKLEGREEGAKGKGKQMEVCG